MRSKPKRKVIEELPHRKDEWTRIEFIYRRCLLYSREFGGPALAAALVGAGRRGVKQSSVLLAGVNRTQVIASQLDWSGIVKCECNQRRRRKVDHWVIGGESIVAGGQCRVDVGRKR